MITLSDSREPVSGSTLYRAAYEWLAAQCVKNPPAVRCLFGTDAVIAMTARLVCEKRLALKIETVDEASEAANILCAYLRNELKKAGIGKATVSAAIGNPKLPAAFVITCRSENRIAVFEWQRGIVRYSYANRAGFERDEWTDTETEDKDVAALVVTHLRAS